MLPAYYMQALFLTLGISRKQDHSKTLPPRDFCLVGPRKETIYNIINIYNKISGKDKAVKKINQDKQTEQDLWNTAFSASPLAGIH